MLILHNVSYTKFGISPIEHVKGDLEELSKYYPKNLKRIFLVNGDAFALQAKKITCYFRLDSWIFPRVECITCYASITNIKPKSDEDLKKLRQKGFNELYIGLETAYDPALDQMRKGYTQKD